MPEKYEASIKHLSIIGAVILVIGGVISYFMFRPKTLPPETITIDRIDTRYTDSVNIKIAEKEKIIDSLNGENAKLANLKPQIIIKYKNIYYQIDTTTSFSTLNDIIFKDYNSADSLR